MREVAREICQTLRVNTVSVTLFRAFLRLYCGAGWIFLVGYTWGHLEKQ